MSHDEGLATRIREQIEGTVGLRGKNMFGGIAFLLHGNMFCGILGEDLIVRIGKEQYEAALEQPYTKVFDITGKTMRGWVVVQTEGHAEEDDLALWLKKGIDYARTLPTK